MERSTRFENTKSSLLVGQQENSKSMSFSYIFAVLRHRLNFIVVPLALTLTIALLYLLYTPARYTATPEGLSSPEETRVVELLLAAAYSLMALSS